jgi:DNA-binding CsgD family transcriptional regulator/tetratricopeptide (TPR) repeat protein
MELIERTEQLSVLNDRFQELKSGQGHSVFLIGEAGAGKTSLVNEFVKNVENTVVTFIGVCDSLFTPRPLGPLYDIADQIGNDFFALLKDEKDRALIFASLLQKLSELSKPIILVFEDIHWADEATLDLIKFLTRRINRHKCLFLLTFRSDEIHVAHPLRTMFGELPPANFSKMHIKGFSRETVDQLAAKKGYTSGNKLFALTGGNPFYVMEILATYSLGIPDRVKDSVLTLFNAKSGNTRQMWELLSIVPSSGIDLDVAKQIENELGNCIDDCIYSGVIVSKPGHLAFKHELFRLAIEESLSPSKRKNLHKKMLDLMLESSSGKRKLAQLVHHARYAEEGELVAKISPLAAREAVALGAHIEASKLYETAIEFTDKDDRLLVELYERHAYECYLTNQITKAIASQRKALEIWRDRKVSLKIGDTLRFLSRLLWYQGTRDEAMSFALEAVTVLESGSPTHERALAYSNLAQLYMLAGYRKETLHWCQNAIDLAKEMEDHEVLSHALNNLGTVLLMYDEPDGEKKLNQSLAVALENNLHEHVARAYTNLSTGFFTSKSYKKAFAAFDAGLKYCEAHDLDSWRYYMLSDKCGLLLETGDWSEAETLALALYSNSIHPNIVRIGLIKVLALLNIRRGKFEEAARLISEGKKLAVPTREAHRIITILCAELELCWIKGDPIPASEITAAENTLFPEKQNSWHYTQLAYWKHKCGVLGDEESAANFNGPFQFECQGNWQAAIEQWNESGSVYEYALALFQGDEEQQRISLKILNTLGASATYAMLKSKLKLNGVLKIPRGPRESTKKNPAHLTDRQINVLTLLHEGLQNNEIADRLFVSPKTVEHHISAILSKLEVNSRSKAVLQAQKLGIFTPKK